MYLGDGTISSHPRGVYRLRIFLDRAYPVIVQECQAAMSIDLPASGASVYSHNPGRLRRGLLHSDGCRVVNKIRQPAKTYEDPRYFFSNRSLDIQRIFSDACDRLEIAWRRDGRWNISIARREAVAITDRHVGPKR